MEMLLLSVFTNQNNEHEIAELAENEDSSDETESDNQADESSHSSTLNLRSRHVLRAQQGMTNATRKRLLHQLEQEEESKLCVVCQDRKKCVIVLPCRHLCLCVECCIVIRRGLGTCPMCRQVVRRTMKIYI
jgi:RING finger protein 26